MTTQQQRLEAITPLRDFIANEENAYSIEHVYWTSTPSTQKTRTEDPAGHRRA